MWKQRAQQRVYWTGAAFFVEADLALHKQGKSVAAIIKQYQLCCRAARTSAKTLIKELDKLSPCTRNIIRALTFLLLLKRS